MTPPIDPFAGLVSTLSRGARAAYPFIRGLAISNPDLPASQIYDQLRGAGFPLRRQTTLDIIALLRNKADIPRFERLFGPNAPIPDQLHTYSPIAFRGGARVQYLVGITSDNPLIPSAIFVNSRHNLSTNEIYANAFATLAGPSFGPESGYDASQISLLTIEDAKFSPGLQLTGDFPPPEF